MVQRQSRAGGTDGDRVEEEVGWRGERKKEKKKVQRKKEQVRFTQQCCHTGTISLSSTRLVTICYISCTSTHQVSAS